MVVEVVVLAVEEEVDKAIQLVIILIPITSRFYKIPNQVWNYNEKQNPIGVLFFIFIFYNVQFGFGSNVL
jgi:hypothetical protein